MDGWNPYFTVTTAVFAIYVLFAVLGSRASHSARAGVRRNS